MNFQNIDLRHVFTGVRLSRQEIVEAEYRALCVRTERRQKAAKARLVERHVEPRVAIGSKYVPPAVAKHFQHIGWIRGAA